MAFIVDRCEDGQAHHDEQARPRLVEMRQVVGKKYPSLDRAALFVTVPPSAGSAVNEAVARGPRSAAALCAQADAFLASARSDDLSFQEAPLVSDHFAGPPGLIARLGRYTVPMPALRAGMMLGPRIPM